MSNREGGRFPFLSRRTTNRRGFQIAEMEKQEGERNFLTNDDNDDDDDDAHESTWTSMVRNDVIR